MSGMDFTDKRVLVTGGTRGIGYGAVTAFLDAGATSPPREYVNLV